MITHQDNEPDTRPGLIGTCSVCGEGCCNCRACLKLKEGMRGRCFGCLGIPVQVVPSGNPRRALAVAVFGGDEGLTPLPQNKPTRRGIRRGMEISW